MHSKLFQMDTMELNSHRDGCLIVNNPMAAKLSTDDDTAPIWFHIRGQTIKHWNEEC